MSLEYKNLRDKISGSARSNAELEQYYLNTSEEYRKHVDLSVFQHHFSQNSPSSFLWHDYEGGGIHATISPSTQFAAVRTDENLNVVDIPIDVLCKPPLDNLIHPEAALLTGLSPMRLLRDGLQEHDFFRIIYNEMIIPNTCSAGYNSLSYDDEMTRAGFFRNLFPMYKREFSNGNSRWDIFPVLMAYFATRPAGITFPLNDSGEPSLKLEDLAKANGILQESAHNALDDVYALIGLCKLLKSSNKKLWDHLYYRRTKKPVIEDVNKAMAKGQPMLHISGYAGKSNYCMQLIKPIGFSQAKGGNNTLIAIKLDDTLPSWTALSLIEAESLLYAEKEEVNALGKSRPGIVSIKVNKCPILLPASITNDSEVHKKIGFNKSVPDKLREWQPFIDPASTLARAILNKEADLKVPPYIDTALYSYGFPSDSDDWAMVENTSLTSEEYMDKNCQYSAPHLQQLHIKKLIALGSNAVDESTLNKHKELSRERILEPKDKRASLSDVLDSLEGLVAENDKQQSILDDYDDYLSHIDKRLNLTT